GLPVIFLREIPGGEFASKCSRIIQSNAVYGSVKGIPVVPGIDLHIFVGMKGFASERAHRKFPVPFGLSLYRKKEQGGDCQDDSSHARPSQLHHVAPPILLSKVMGRAYNEV